MHHSTHDSAVIALSLIERMKPQPAMCFDCGRFLLAASRSVCFSMTSQVAKSISFALALRCLPSITRRLLRSCAICFCRRYSGDCLGYLRCCRLRLAIMRISLLCGACLTSKSDTYHNRQRRPHHTVCHHLRHANTPRQHASLSGSQLRAC